MDSLRYLTSTSLCWLVVPFSILFETINYLDRNQPWRDDFLWASDWAGTAVFLTVPFLTGLVAADTGILMSTRRRDLTLSAPRAGLSLVRPAAFAAGACILVHLLFLAPYALEAHPSTRSAGPAAFVVAAQVAALVFFVLLGALLGAVLTLPWGPLAGAVGAPALMWFLGRDTGLFSPLDVGGSTSSLLGLGVNERFAFAQAVWLAAALAATAALLAWRWPWGGGTKFWALSAAPFALLLLAVLVLAKVPGMDRLELAVTPQRECVGSEPEICVYPEHQRFAAMVRENVERIYGNVPAQVAAALPTRIDERVPGGARPSAAGMGAFEVLPDSFSQDSIPLESTAADLVTPWRCPEIFGQQPPPERYFAAAQLLTDELAAAGEGGSSLTDPERQRQFLGLLEEVSSCRILRS